MLDKGRFSSLLIRAVLQNSEVAFEQHNNDII